jgi:hypothetical protein
MHILLWRWRRRHHFCASLPLAFHISPYYGIWGRSKTCLVDGPGWHNRSNYLVLQTKAIRTLLRSHATERCEGHILLRSLVRTEA